jgi:hypothetical protein
VGAWTTYQLSDLLLFAPRVYYRVFERINEEAWPLHFLLALFGLAMLAVMARPGVARVRAIFMLLGANWISLAWFFFARHYATINWAAEWIAPTFLLQGVLLIVIGAWPRALAYAVTNSPPRLAIVGMVLALAVAGYPLIALSIGRPIDQAEFFGIFPDPTTVATLAFLALLRGTVFRLAAIIPFLWCIVTGLTLWTMGDPAFWVAPVLGSSVLLVGMSQRRRPANVI